MIHHHKIHKGMRNILLGASILGLSACTSGIIGTASYDREGKHEMSSSMQNPILGMRVEIDDIITTRVNGFLLANIKFRSKWSFSQDIKYRVHWFDAEGIEIDPERPNWNNIVLTGKAEKTIKVTSPNDKAIELKVFVRD